MRLASLLHHRTLRITLPLVASVLVLFLVSFGEEPASSDPETVPVRVFRGTEEDLVHAPRDPAHGSQPSPSPSPAVRSIALASEADDERPDPTAWLAAFEEIYESGDSAAYATLLGEDYRFLSGDASFAERFPEGFTRGDELSSYARLFRGATAADGAPLPRAKRVDVVWHDVRVLPDPEFPDDAAHALVRVGQATLAIEFADGSSMRDTAPHAFWLVLAAGEASDGGAARGWVCRRWVERPAESVLAAIGDPPGAILPGQPSAPVPDPDPAGANEPVLAPRWTPYPPVGRGGSVAYAYEVASPGTRVSLELFDAAGRRVSGIEEGMRPAGRHLARWNGRTDAGVQAAPGVYFLRARVGEREERSRVIVLQ